MTDYQYDYQIGTTSGNLVNVESLVGGLYPMPPPVGLYKPYEEAVDTENGDIIGLGLPTVVWLFPELTLGQRDALRAYCTGNSAKVYIKTKGIDSADTYLKLTGKVIWPLEEGERREAAGRRLEFRLIFIMMEAFT